MGLSYAEFLLLFESSSSPTPDFELPVIKDFVLFGVWEEIRWRRWLWGVGMVPMT